MSVLSHRSRMSVEEYLTLDRNSPDTRYEYIDGYVRMLAGGTPAHAMISANVIIIQGIALRGRSCYVFTSDVRVRLSSDRYVYPDVTISCDKQDRQRRDALQSPRTVVEVLSPGTRKYDQGEKFSYYRECPTIQEYILIDSGKRNIEVFRREKDPLWSLHTFRNNDTIDLISLGVRFKVAEVYENVEFPSLDFE